jgi:hypothetical protein
MRCHGTARCQTDSAGLGAEQIKFARATCKKSEKKNALRNRQK